MKGTFKLKRIDDVTAEMNISMTIGSWRVLLQHFRASHNAYNYPMCDFQALVANLINQAESEFFSEVKEPEKQENNSEILNL